MKTKSLKKFFDKEIENQKLPDFGQFMKGIPHDKIEKHKHENSLYNFILQGAFAFSVVILIAVSSVAKTPYKETFQRLCQQNNCDFNIGKQLIKMRNHLEKVKKYLNEEA